MLTTLLAQLKNQPDTVQFKDVIDCIAATYLYTPSQFTNGEQVNEAGQNEGSCKIFAFAQLNNLDEQSTLHCFGDYYRQDVLQHPENSDHQNIRQFMLHGWQGVKFANAALVAK